ncbi:uncharacterized protein GGS22DRAFT_195372 [Annulohypoxylon maeteangense]|uniref:uncharacterized protein n=1 Tax=Annulohypoxylon maeteangense TaxID=1927788 RepID=UPI00200813A6|nr:uncharacterized protein GGS22DRAFT_195372 [Annulohypoxylon maeteangense]KAI0883129.1 hypothetical protein GGS22DRAFT_195372 [Annulohypoxylon maeteangense]
MSGLEALSIACNIMQVISFAHETVSFCKAIYQGKSIDEYGGHDIASLSALSAQLRKHYQNIKPKTTDEKQLEDIAKKCNIAARALEEEVAFLLSHNAKGHLAQTLRIAVKTNWRKGRLERLRNSLRNHQHTMESYLLARVCKKTDAIELQQCQGFAQLSKDVQFFISQYTIGCTKVVDLVNAELVSAKEATVNKVSQSEESIKKHVSHEMSMVEKTVAVHVTKERNELFKDIAKTTIDMDAKHTKEMQRDKLLKSLRLSIMNARRNRVADASMNTYKWIFSPNEELDDTSWDRFDDWLKSDSDMYWISGKPRSGKSTLMKYILENPLTKASLETWGTNPIILSHFFWKPGSKMENNIKGFLCSILHQALHSNIAVIDSILATSDSLSSKESYDDWSMKELKEACLAILGMYPSSLCIFLDGLDEVCSEDEQLALLELVDDIRRLPNVKICVASRPEPLLRSSLSKHQQLKLQDLTKNDMWEYANAQISKNHGLDKQGTKYFTDILVEKAEGVFLWLHLAISSLIRGFKKDDTIEVLYQRLGELPNELSLLYSEMWNRMNGDTTLYRQAAALYFNLLIGLEDPQGLPVYSSSPHVFLFMVVSEPEVRNTFVDRRDATYGYRDSRTSLTAYDYLTDTEEGIRIRTYDSSSLDTKHILLAEAQFASVMMFPDYNGAARILAPLSRATDRSSQKTVDQLLRATYYHYGGIGGSIYKSLALFVTCPTFSDSILSIIAESPNPALLATDILRNMHIIIGNLRGDLNSRFYDVDPVKGMERQPIMFFSPFEIFIIGVLDQPPTVPVAPETYKTLQVFMKNQPNLKRPLPITMEINKCSKCSIHTRSIAHFFRTGQSQIRSERDRVTLALNMDMASLVMAIYEYGRKRNLLTSSEFSFGYNIIQSYFNDHRGLANPENHILFIVFSGGVYCQPTRQHMTPELLALISRHLCGEESQELYQEIYQCAIDIAQDIRSDPNQSVKAREFQSTESKILSFLADRNCGFRWSY